jgi:hypothetical protein
MRESLVELYRRAKSFHEQAYRITSELQSAVRQCRSQEDLADDVYAIRQATKFVEDARKEMGKLERLAEKMCCALWVQAGLGDPISTRHCSASPDVKMMASLPNRHTQPEAYEKLMRHLGVPESLWRDGDHASVEIHWLGFTDMLSRDLAAGRPLPPGIDPEKTYPEYRLSPVRGKMGVDE